VCATSTQGEEWRGAPRLEREDNGRVLGRAIGAIFEVHTFDSTTGLKELAKVRLLRGRRHVGDEYGRHRRWWMGGGAGTVVTGCCVSARGRPLLFDLTQFIA